MREDQPIPYRVKTDEADIALTKAIKLHHWTTVAKIPSGKRKLGKARNTWRKK